MLESLRVTALGSNTKFYSYVVLTRICCRLGLGLFDNDEHGNNNGTFNCFIQESEPLDINPVQSTD